MPLRELILQIKNFKLIMFMVTEATIPDPILNTTLTVKLSTIMQAAVSFLINLKTLKKSTPNIMMILLV